MTVLRGAAKVNSLAMFAAPFPASGLLRVDPQAQRVVAEVPLPGGDSIAAGAGSLWLTRTSDNTLVRITPDR